MLVRVEGTLWPIRRHSIRSNSCAPFAVARITMPRELSCVFPRAVRKMSESVQTLCFLAGANSIFYGEKLLTTENPEAQHDLACWTSWA